MKKKAVSAIRKTGTAAAIENVEASSLINAHLVKATSERFVDASAVAELKALSALLLSLKKYDAAFARGGGLLTGRAGGSRM